ncbi:hypothetical protein THASP1DRAFT_28175 [Thamnocephalis sphaerospora]|uniref:D-xylose 1-dehydrogenase (NADP(+), D-xylono-1,5-lactone-forming) n=1 Tax=Thamnocephalis sphaerospora TaxID=78915 RepID=A0A4P9XUZ6_9FUNG|nr:hypothetical protein THASP1DRAFT_28175 [Thamnocephalis sphaerospora]|eukprot:RKP10058.1 hypothetical protein THASP1DRAFT_28175 [Thamnocephalis sphaerospora]
MSSADANPSAPANTASPGLFVRLWRLAFPPPALPRDSDALRIGILGAASIAPMSLITPARHVPGILVASVAARSHERAKQFAVKHGIPTTHASYDELINDPSIDAIYNPLPNSLHYEWTMKAIQAGKHVLLEKPATSNADEAERLVAAAKTKGVVLLEAFHYRFHPAMLRVLDIVHSGELGELRRIECRAVAPNVFNADDIRFNLGLAGGACMDIGSYALNAIRAVVGGIVPERVHEATAELVAPDVDHTMHFTLDFDDGVTAVGEASLNCSWFNMISSLRVIGSQKELCLRNYILPTIWHSIVVQELPGGKKRTEKHYGDGSTTYAYMLHHFVALCRGETDDYVVTHDDTVGNMRTMDMVYQAAGLSVRGPPTPNA